MNFEFINSSTINPRDRKRIRSHVMKGKNAGKIRPPKANVAVTKQNTFRAEIPASGQHSRSSTTSNMTGRGSSAGPKPNAAPQSSLGSKACLVVDLGQIAKNAPWPIASDIPRSPCNEMAMWPMPIILTTEKLNNIHSYLGIVSTALYPPEICSREDIVESIWIRYMFEDEAYLHTTLALCVTYVDASIIKASNYDKAIPHISRACNILNHRLSGREATSDLTIAAVLQLSIFERFQGNYETGSIHLRGLRHMVELRGGPSQLGYNSPLIQKIFRADFELALHFATHPLFACSDVPGQDILTALQRSLFDDQAYNSAEFPFLLDISDGLRDLFLDILSIGHYLQTQANRASKLTPELFQAILIKVCYKLMENWNPQTHNCSNNTEILLQLSLMAFMVTFWYPWGEKSEMFPPLYEGFRGVVETTSQDCMGLDKFLLWAVLIGKCSMFSSQNDEPWLISIFAKLARGMRILTWEDTRHAIRGLPWTHFLHETRGKDLFTKAEAEVMLSSSARIHGGGLHQGPSFLSKP